MKTNINKSCFNKICLIAGTCSLWIAGHKSSAAQFSLKVPVQENTPSDVVQMNDEMPAIIGAWSGEVQIEGHQVRAQLTLNQDNQFHSLIIVADPDNRIVGNEKSTGKWIAENGILNLQDSTDQSVEKFSFRMDQGVLFLKEDKPDGLEIRMIPGSVKPPTNGLPPTNPAPESLQSPRAVTNELAGQWHATSELPIGRVNVLIQITEDGKFTSQLSLPTPNGNQQVSNQGQLSLQGNQLIFAGMQGNETVPFAIQGGNLILDYSQSNGFILQLSRQPGKGSLRFLNLRASSPNPEGPNAEGPYRYGPNSYGPNSGGYPAKVPQTPVYPGFNPSGNDRFGMPNHDDDYSSIRD